MKYLIFTIAPIMLAVLFGFNLRGLSGAFILGVTVLIIDYGCLRLRINLLRRNGTSFKLAAIVGGFLSRFLNIVILMSLGVWWLVPAAHYLFYWILITIPIWNLLDAIRLTDQI